MLIKSLQYTIAGGPKSNEIIGSFKFVLKNPLGGFENKSLVKGVSSEIPNSVLKIPIGFVQATRVVFCYGYNIIFRLAIFTFTLGLQTCAITYSFTFEEQFFLQTALPNNLSSCC